MISTTPLSTTDPRQVAVDRLARDVQIPLTRLTGLLQLVSTARLDTCPPYMTALALSHLADLSQAILESLRTAIEDAA